MHGKRTEPFSLRLDCFAALAMTIAPSFVIASIARPSSFLFLVWLDCFAALAMTSGGQEGGQIPDRFHAAIARL